MRQDFNAVFLINVSSSWIAEFCITGTFSNAVIQYCLSDDTILAGRVVSCFI